VSLPLRRRVVELVLGHLELYVPGVVRFEKDLLGTGELERTQYPALFVVPATAARGETQHQPGRHVRESMSLDVIGYVISASGGPDGLADAREALLQSVLNALYLEDGAGHEILEQACQTDLQAHGGSGCISVEHTAPPDTDGGLTPPFGIFALPCEAILHYRRGQA
jgi:hypothetical protein